MCFENCILKTGVRLSNNDIKFGITLGRNQEDECNYFSNTSVSFKVTIMFLKVEIQVLTLRKHVPQIYE